MTPAGAALDPERRAALNAAKLVALVDAAFGPADRERHTFGIGAALTQAGDGGIVAYVLVDTHAERGLGPALVWADRAGATELHVLAGTGIGVLARRAAEFALAPTVWEVSDAGLAPATPEPVVVADPLHAPELVDLLLDAGLEIVVEGGTLRAEVLGLEVARVVPGDDGPVLEVGVGRADRELTAMLHGDLAPTGQLERVIAIVREHRRAGAPPHPLNQLVPERWMRARLCDRPERVGLAHLAPIDAGAPRPNLRARWTAPARGTAADGTTVTVVCSVGIDLDLVPAAADARLSVDPGSRLLLVVPERDDHPANRRLAGALCAPAEVVVLPDDWRA